LWVFGGGEVGGYDAAAGDDEAGDSRPLGKADIFLRAGKGEEGAADFCAGGVSAGVQNAGQRMRAFARTQILAIEGMAFGVRGLIEVRPPLDEFLHALGTLRHQRCGRRAVDNSVAGVHRVFEVQGNVFLTLHGDSNAALRVVRIRFAERFLGDDENFAVLRELDGSAKAGDARAHHQEIHLRTLCHTL
jgi:hypothetical protein